MREIRMSGSVGRGLRPPYPIRSVVIGRERPVAHPLHPIRGTSWVDRPAGRHDGAIRPGYPAMGGIPRRRGHTAGRPS